MPILAELLICIFLSLPVAAVSTENRLTPLTCTYEMQVWNVNQKNSVMKQKVRHAYDALSSEEIDTLTGCTVCSEDQEVISVPPLPLFSVCYRIAPQVRRVISHLIRNNAPVHTVVGYHVIKSRGAIDRNGNRTGFSNHSYGTAIDINPEQNGLYDNCITFGPECRLLRGGEWRVGNAGSLEPAGDIVTAFKGAGFCWGGEIAGWQKDFMHFSFTGY